MIHSWRSSAKRYHSRHQSLLPHNNDLKAGLLAYLAHKKTADEILWMSATLMWKSWGEDIVVYNFASGNTHLLTPIAAQVLKLIEARPRNCSEIARELSGAVTVSLDDEITQEVQNLLLSLDELGLAHPTA
jgi:PqqD family protein of HPr-rel-A system